MRSRGAISEKGNERGPRPKPTGAQHLPNGARPRASVGRERKSRSGSLKVVRVRPNTPRQESSGGTVRLLKWARRSAGPSPRLRRAGGGAGRAAPPPTRPSSGVCGRAPPAGCRLVLSCQVLAMHKHTAGTPGTRQLGTPAPTRVLLNTGPQQAAVSKE